MTREKRISYLITTLCVFITGFLIYSFLAAHAPIDDNTPSFLLLGFFGGFGFSMILSTIILASNFFSKRKLIFKIIAAILWPLTFCCALYAGAFCYIPYQIYNIVKIIKEKPNTSIE